jgi:hypothetical protein
MKKQDYLDNLKIFSKVCYVLGIIRYKHQFFSGGRYVGNFKLVLLNPLTWTLIVLIFIFLFLASLYNALRYSILNIKGFIAEGAVVELERDYKSKE